MDLYTEAEQTILRELDPGERLLWSGQPAGGIKFRRSDLYAIPFSLFWAGFMVFWTVGVTKNGTNLLPGMFAVPFLTIGGYILVGRFFHDAWRRRRTFYGVTDQRVLIVTASGARKTTSFVLRSLPAITLLEKRNGVGDVVLGDADANDVAFGRMSRNSGASREPPMLEMIRDPRQVYNLIRQTQGRLTHP